MTMSRHIHQKVIWTDTNQSGYIWDDGENMHQFGAEEVSKIQVAYRQAGTHTLGELLTSSQLRVRYWRIVSFFDRHLRGAD